MRVCSGSGNVKNRLVPMSFAPKQLHTNYSPPFVSFKPNIETYQLIDARQRKLGTAPRYIECTAPAPTDAPNFFSTRSGKPSCAV
jgi:hypothetical protein